MQQMVLADYNLKRAQEVQKKLGSRKRFPVEQVDASDKKQIVALAKKYGVDLDHERRRPRVQRKDF